MMNNDTNHLSRKIKMRLLLQDRIRAFVPTVGIKETKPITLKGDWWIVIPQTARDVIFLQLLGEHQRYANFNGNGILIPENVLPQNSQN